MSQLKGELIDLDGAKSMIIGFDDIKINNKPLPGEVIHKVAAHLGVTEEEIKSNSRGAQIVYARRLSSFILNKDLNLTLSASGSILGNKNHATVLNAVRFVESSLESDFDMRHSLQKIRNSLRIF
ncbi:MAG: helix-turn-helix domain-containing protein [Chloroflexota bacterium]|nr:helix-turn-helix domain-containing protein [Chloroflexota bacterium]